MSIRRTVATTIDRLDSIRRRRSTARAPTQQRSWPRRTEVLAKATEKGLNLTLQSRQQLKHLSRFNDDHWNGLRCNGDLGLNCQNSNVLNLFLLDQTREGRISQSFAQRKRVILPNGASLFGKGDNGKLRYKS
jgi:hypothetical protein